MAPACKAGILPTELSPHAVLSFLLILDPIFSRKINKNVTGF